MNWLECVVTSLIVSLCCCIFVYQFLFYRFDKLIRNIRVGSHNFWTMESTNLNFLCAKISWCRWLVLEQKRKILFIVRRVENSRSASVRFRVFVFLYATNSGNPESLPRAMWAFIAPKGNSEQLGDRNL